MRKRLKKKLRSCARCKPHKMGWDKEFDAETHFMLRAKKGAGKKERGLALLVKAS